MTSTLTCMSCRVAFRDLEVQRQHYKSDWHRYILKRKAADLPPVTVEDFQKRVIAQRTKADEDNQSQNLTCQLCRKNFHTQNQYDNNLLSKTHKASLKKSQCHVIRIPQTLSYVDYKCLNCHISNSKGLNT